MDKKQDSQKIKSVSEQYQLSRVSVKGNKSPVKPNGKKKKPWTFKRVMLRIVVPILLTLVVLVGGAYIGVRQYEKYLLGKIHYIPKQENPTFVNEEGSVVTLAHYTSETVALPVEEEHVHNFLLIGIDSRSKNYTEDGSGSLADVIMVLSVDDEAGTLKMLTIQRDCYVSVPGYSKLQKINAAMTYGGPELLSVVIENHLRLKLDGYAYVNFYHMEEVIDAVGGIDIELSKNEVFHSPGGLNANLVEQNRLHGDPDEKYFLTEAGWQHLNGRQAVAYSRIRKVGNGVYERTERQVTVLNELMRVFTEMSTTSKLSVLDDILGLVATNISPEEIEEYALDFLPRVRDMKIETMGIPIEGYSVEGLYSDVRASDWSIRCDWNGMIPLVQKFFYGETYEFDLVPEIPKAPKHDENGNLIEAGVPGH